MLQQSFDASAVLEHPSETQYSLRTQYQELDGLQVLSLEQLDGLQ
jgi:hypothetical protein